MMPVYSIGVEEEYQLVDPRTGALQSAAPRVLDGDWSGELHPEMLQTMLEVSTPPCRSAEEVAAQLARLRFQAATGAAAHELSIVAAGVHPCDGWRGHKSTPEARYDDVVERLGRVARTDHIFGMHVHVQVPEGVDRMQVIAAARAYLPHLTALAASSPIYDREDTGYASYRTILADRLPNSGMPPALRSERDFERLLQVMLQAGVLPDAASLYWGLRPHSRFPTVEFRVMDVCPRISDAVAIATLVRALVATIAEEGVEVRAEGFAAHAADVLLRANQWQACRYGLDAAIISPATPTGWEPLRDAIRALVERVAPTAEELGDGERLAGVLEILENGTAADRIRRRHASNGELPELVGWLSTESLSGTGMDEAAFGVRPLDNLLST
jgi:glutamate---cysteine ligase / carboxylate-amine ligase